MIKLTFLLVIGVITGQAYGDAPEAIVGGFIATDGQFPYQASLQVMKEHICGGSIISSKHILTAAHCVEEKWQHRYMTVVSGATRWAEGNNNQRHTIKCIRLHPGYTGEKSSAWKDDIAVITLNEEIKFDKWRSPIPLASQDYTTGTYKGIVSGWGQTSVTSDSSPVLKWLAVDVLSKVECLKAHRNPQTNKQQVCSIYMKNHGACSGDSGGPLVVNKELCGIVSWVALCALGIPDVYTNVYDYLDFIKDSQKACGDAPEAIVGGNFAKEGQFKHQISIQVNKEHICGGTIISPTHIVTAAHCVDNPKYRKGMTIVTGTIKWATGQTHNIKCIRMHPGYTGKKEDAWKNDIAVITLTQPITFNNVQGSIPLASRDYTVGSNRGITSGWGKTSVDSKTSPALKWLGVNILSEKDCLKAHKNPQTIKTQICTLEKKGQGACSGDSGGPLIFNGELCGVTSWVALCALGVPDVFTHVYHYTDFIKECQKMC
ncbi:PREDICTED: coagulation factor IX-like [Dinoponera quadriceps]|uniref:Coagulation factor IX-like n=1 Tax=Dinoponera quadriceps TaxID=609295 RepID=A0A6P3X6Z0_DINQU|nr:PREDICTED: coagulation factor IX-like [Dinoponera quadriceps]